MLPRTHSGVLILVSAVMAVISLGLIAYALVVGAPLHYDDERQYVELAESLRSGQGFVLNGSPTAYRPPAWPLLIAMFLWLGIPASAISVVPAAAMIGAAVVAAMIGVRLSQSPWGALAGIAVLIYPVNVYTAVTLYPQAFATLLVLTLWLLLLIITGSRPVPRWQAGLRYAALGLVAAILSLSVPTMTFTAVVVVVWAIFAAKGYRARAAIYTLTAFVAPVGVWASRNIAVLDAPVPLSTSTGLNLLIGNNPTATGSSGVAVDIRGPLQAASSLSEVDGDAYLRNTAVDWIIHNPVDALTLYAAKVLNYFSPYNEPVTASAGSNAQRLIAYSSCAVLVILIVARVLLRRQLPFGASERLFIALFLANALVMAVFFTRTRFRQPLDNILLVEAAVAVAILIGMMATRRELPETDEADSQSTIGRNSHTDRRQT